MAAFDSPGRVVVEGFMYKYFVVYRVFFDEIAREEFHAWADMMRFKRYLPVGAVLDYGEIHAAGKPLAA